MTQVNKLGYLALALEVDGLLDRLVFGTDWPLQFFPLVSPWYHLDHISMTTAKSIGTLNNSWDRDVALKVAYGVPEAVFLRSRQLIERPLGAR